MVRASQAAQAMFLELWKPLFLEHWLLLCSQFFFSKNWGAGDDSVAQLLGAWVTRTGPRRALLALLVCRDAAAFCPCQERWELRELCYCMLV